MEAIIYGGGRLATTLAQELTEGGYTVTVIDSDADYLESVSAPPAIQTIRVIAPTMQDVLAEAQLATTELLAALSNDDQSNALVAQMGLHVFKVPAVICRLDNPDLRELYSGLGLKTVGLSEMDLFSRIRQHVAGETDD